MCESARARRRPFPFDPVTCVSRHRRFVRCCAELIAPRRLPATWPARFVNFVSAWRADRRGSIRGDGKGRLRAPFRFVLAPLGISDIADVSSGGGVMRSGHTIAATLMPFCLSIGANVRQV